MKKYFSMLLLTLGMLAFGIPAVAQGSNDIATGYYYVYKSESQALTNINLGLKWDPLQRGNAAFIFHLEKAETGDDEYWMQSLVDGSWFYGVTNYYVTEFRANEADKATIRFTPIADQEGRYGIRPTKSRPDLTGDNDIHNYFQTTGSRKEGGVFAGGPNDYHPLAQWSADAWIVEQVPANELATAKLRVALVKAIEEYQNAYHFTAGAEGLITNASDGDDRTGAGSQFFTTCQVGDSYSSIKNLIDGDLNTCFQSTWNADQAEAPQWLQVDAGKEVEGFRLQIGLRNGDWGSAEMWQDVTLYATNDEAAATNAEIATIDDVKANAAWTRIGEYNFSTEKSLAFGNGNWGLQMIKGVAEATDRIQTKDFLLQGKKYRYLRFYVNQTMNPQSDNKDFTLGELQIFEIANPVAEASLAPKAAKLAVLIASSEQLIANGSATEADVDALVKATNATPEDFGMFSTGYYYIYKNDAQALTNINLGLKWDPLQRGNAAFIFRLEKAEGADDEYWMQSLVDDSWFYGVTNYYVTEFRADEADKATIRFTPLADNDGYYGIRPTTSRPDLTGDNDIHNYFQTTGSRQTSFSGTTNDYHPLAQWSAEAWRVEKVSESELAAAKLRIALVKAIEASQNAYSYTAASEGLITSANDGDDRTGAGSQFFTTCQVGDSYSSIKNLIDGDLNTCFQSTWNAGQAEAPQWLQVDAGKEVEGFRLQIGLRNGDWGSAEMWQDITLYATNDEAAATNAEIATIDDVKANAAWTRIGEYNFSTEKSLALGDGNWGFQMVKAIAEATDRYQTKDFVFNGKKYRYLRFYVNQTMNPQSDNKDFTLGELQIFEIANPAVSSAYADKVDALNQLIEKAEKTLAAGTGATESDVEALIEATKEVTVASAATLVSTFDKAKPLVTNVDQLSANAIQVGDGGGLAALIDGNLATHFHSAYNSNNGSTLPDAKQYLQVDLSATPVSQIYFTLNGRSGGYHDTPTDITVLASNDGEEWTEVTQLENIIDGNPADAYVAQYVDLKSTYKYVRFVVDRSTQGRTVAVNGNTYYFWNATEFQVYAAEEVNVALQAAYQLYGSEKDYDTDGTDPGYYSAEKKAEFEATMAEVRSTATGIIPNEQAESLAQKLNDALAALQSSLIEVTDGYYSFINAFPTFEANQGVKKAITANDANLTWGTYDEADPAYLFKVTKLEDGSYSVQNVKNNKYINTVPGRSAVVPVSDEQVTGQIFTLIAGTVQFNLANTANAESYHPAGHSGGDGISGNIVGYPGGANTQSAWYVHKITDEAEIAELIDKAEKAQSSAKLNDLIQQAWVAVHDAGEALITNATDGDEACQFSSNAKESREGSYAALIDNNIATFFHSVWSAAGPETPHNLQIDLGQKAQVLNYTFTSRGSGNHDVPYVFNILATNSDELGANAESADDEWTLIAEVEDKTIPNINGFVYNNTIDLGSQYRYVRFVVLNTTDQVNGRVNSTTGQPYFNLSEFQIYANTENSDYAASQEVKTAVDELNALILADVAKVANLEAKNEDVEALAAALDKAKSIIAEVKEQRSQEQVNTDL
ncbi:MAG: discoidin domain-containing protein, partial [Bacteroidaceae bacterium]|nr:discoidin domain-containing protein [Bacteroidaceae bacterium]